MGDSRVKVREFIAPLASVMLMTLGSSFFLTFISLRLSDDNGGGVAVGLVHAAFYLGLMVGSVGIERFIYRLGHIQTLAAFGSLLPVTILAQALWMDTAFWCVLRFFAGVSLAALYVVVESWLLQKSSHNTRGVVLSIYMIVLYAAQSVSQQFLHVLAIAAVTPFIVAALFSSAGVIPVSLSSKKINVPTVGFEINLLKLIRLSFFGVTGCFVAGLLLSSLYSFVPIFTLDFGYSPGNMMTLLIAGAVILQWPVGKLSDIIDRRLVLLILCGFTLVSMMTLGIFTSFSHLFMLALFCLGGGAFTIYPLCINQVCDRLDAEQYTAAAAWLLVVYGLGAVAGPVLTSIANLYLGSIGLVYFSSVILIGLLVCGVLTMSRVKPVPEEEQGAWVPMPPVTPIALEMNPNADLENGENSLSADSQ